VPNDPDANRPATTSLGQGGRYLIRRVLGRGMMGVVWEAEDTVLGRTVALKTIELGFDVGDDAREQFEHRFFTEARVAAQLSHPGIVVCHDVDKDPATGKLFIVFEHLKGHTLAERVLAGPVPWRETLAIVVAVARAAHHAHEHGVVHRDLKPANVMLLEGRPGGDAGTVKIMDFGVARLESTEPRLTSDGDRFGSPAYMSPEMTLGLASDAHSDIFSIGSILCTCLLGREWFAAPNIPTTLQRVVHEDAPVLSVLVPGVPPALDAVVARAMAKRPEDRHATAAELAGDLEDVLAGRWPGVAGAPPRQAVPTTEAETALSELAALVGRRAGTPDPEPGAEHPLAALVTEPMDRLAETPVPPSPPESGRRRPRRLLGRGAAGAAALLVVLATAVVFVRLRLPAAPAAAPAASVAQVAVAPAARAVPTATPGPGTAPEPHPAASSREAPRPPAEAQAGPATPSPPAAAEPSAPGEAAESARAAETPAPTPAVAEARATAAAGQTRLRLDVEHPLESGHLVVWIDGALAYETKLSASTSRKVMALTLRSGHLDTVLGISPGRHEVRVEVRWDGGRRVASTVADAAAGSTGLLEVRLGRMTKDLRLSWSRLGSD